MANPMRTPWLIGGIAVLTALFAGAASSNGLDAWSGTYTYEGQDGYDGGGTASTGNPVILDMTIKIESRSACSLQADGFQTDETLICTVTARHNGTGIDIHFNKFPSGAIEVNGFFDTDYAPDALLLSFVRGTSSPGLVTQWAAIKPDMAKTASGEYFEKTSP